MDAALVSNEHIRVLVWAGCRTAWRDPMTWIDSDGCQHDHFPEIDHVGQALITQNVRSYNRHAPEHAQRPPMYVNRPPRRDYTPVEVLKAIDSYEHHSCWTPDYGQTDAEAYCDSLRRHMVALTPGYRDANCLIEEPAILRPVRAAI